MSVQNALRLYYFITFGAMGLYLPFFATWLRARGFAGTSMGLLMALLPFCQLISPAIVGLLADRFALRGRMMTICAASTAFGLTTLVLTAALFDQIPIALAAVGMFAFAFLRSPTTGLADVLAMETSPDYGRTRLWGSLGFMTSALLGGVMMNPEHPTALPSAIAGLFWLLALVSLLLPKASNLPPRPALADAKKLLSQPTYRALLVTMMLVFGGMTAYDLCITLRLRELLAPGSTVGLFWSIATSSEVLLLFWAARLGRRVGPGKLLTFALVVATGRWVFLSQATNLTLILWMQPLHAITFGLMWVSAIGVLKREAGEHGTATAQGLFGSAIAVGATIGTSIWGAIYDAQGSERLYLYAALVSGLAALSATRLIRLTRVEVVAENPL